MQEAKSTKLKIPNRSNKIHDKISTWAIAKSELVDLQKKSLHRRAWIEIEAYARKTWFVYTNSKRRMGFKKKIVNLEMEMKIKNNRE